MVVKNAKVEFEGRVQHLIVVERRKGSTMDLNLDVIKFKQQPIIDSETGLLVGQAMIPAERKVRCGAPLTYLIENKDGEQYVGSSGDIERLNDDRHPFRQPTTCRAPRSTTLRKTGRPSLRPPGGTTRSSAR